MTVPLLLGGLEEDELALVPPAPAQDQRVRGRSADDGVGLGALRVLRDIPWSAIAARDWRDSAVKEGKQAEFLVERTFPWALVDRIGAHSQTTLERAARAVANAAHKPALEIRREWYY